MLSLNGSNNDTVHWKSVWKVLVIDQFCRDLLSPILKVKDLRDEGVTLHMYVCSLIVRLLCDTL